MDALVVTGPMNSYQLGVPKDPGYAVVTVHPKGDDIGSDAMHQAMTSWLAGESLRARIQRELDEPLGCLGVAWFSAGHGAVRAVLEGSTSPSDVQAWLCLDGLYGQNWWAVDLAKDAARDRTALMATASTSTPGDYSHSLDRWRDAVAKAGLPQADPSVAEAWGLPKPDQTWAQGAAIVAGYESLGHHQQVPAVRAGMLRYWEAVRLGDVPAARSDNSPLVWLGLSALAAGAGAAAGAAIGRAFGRYSR